MRRLVPALAVVLISLAGCSRTALQLDPGPNILSSGGPDHVSTCTAGQWSDVLAAEVSPRVSGIAVDRDCNVFVVGGFSGTVDLGDGPLNSAGGLDAFVLKLTSSGETLWSRQLGELEDQQGFAVAAGDDGSVVVAGYFKGKVDFGGGLLDSAGDATFLVKLDASGNHVYSKRYGALLSPVRVTGLATGPDGEAVMKGYFDGAVDFGGGDVLSAGNNDIFVVKLDRDGAYVFHRRYGDANYQSAGGGIAIDDNGNIVMTGAFDGVVDFGDTIATSGGNRDAFVAKLDPAGETLWSHAYGGDDFAQAAPIALGSDGRVAIAGSFDGSVDFGGGPLMSTLGYHFNLFVIELDANGNHQWSKAFGSADAEEPISLAYGEKDDLLMAGNFAGSLVLGNQELTTTGGWDIFTVRFLAGGVPAGAHQFGDEQSQQCVSATLDPLGQILMTGAFDGSLDLSTGPLEATPGDADAFVARMPHQP